MKRKIASLVCISALVTGCSVADSPESRIGEESHNGSGGILPTEPPIVPPSGPQADPSDETPQQRGGLGAAEVIVRLDGSDPSSLLASFSSHIADSDLTVAPGGKGFLRIQWDELAEKEFLNESVGSRADVLFVEEDHVIEVVEAQAGAIAVFLEGESFADVADQADLGALKLVNAHARTQGNGTRVAILDTGYVPHPDLDDYTVSAFDYVDGDDDALDEGDPEHTVVYGHGTAVAGCVHVVAPEAELVHYRILDDEGRGSVWNLISALSACLVDDIDVVNLSLRVAAYPEAAVELILELQNAGIDVVTSAGNGDLVLMDAPDYFPANLPDSYLIVAGALRGTDYRWSESNIGFRVDVSAPGVNVVTTGVDGGYASFTGTSASAALVSGAVALRRSVGAVANMEDELYSSGDAVPDPHYNGAMIGSRLNVSALVN